MNLSPYIDHTVLKATTNLEDVRKVCEEAVSYGFAAVCIPPYFVRDARRFTEGSMVKTATVIGFPFGYSTPEAKLAEALRALEDGAHELDMVMNNCAFRAGDRKTLEAETGGILYLGKDIQLKVIIESGVLSNEEIIKCCEFYREYPVAFLKTSTGYAESGASTDAVKLMRANLPAHIAIKASGGIRNAAFARALIEAGASRLGCSASVAIVKEGGVEGENGY